MRWPSQALEEKPLKGLGQAPLGVRSPHFGAELTQGPSGLCVSTLVALGWDWN